MKAWIYAAIVSRLPFVRVIGSAGLAISLAAGIACSGSAPEPADAEGADRAATNGERGPSGANDAGEIVESGAPPDAVVSDGSSTDGGPPADGAPDGGSLSCTHLPNTAPKIRSQFVAQNPPPAVGGTLADGLYFLTKVVGYTGQGGFSGSGFSIKDTRDITGGGHFTRLTSFDPDANTTVYRHSTVSTAGNIATYAHACSDSAIKSGRYTATANEFVQFIDYQGTTYVHHYVRQ